MKHRKQWLLTSMLAIAMLGLPALAAGYTVYVNADSGNDSGIGDLPNPWKTITHAVATVTAGTSADEPNVIIVESGDYDIGNGELFPIYFDKDHVVLNGNGPQTTKINTWRNSDPRRTDALVLNAKGILITGFTFDDTLTAIRISEGDFLISNNHFGDLTDLRTSIENGIYFYNSAANLTDSVIFADMDITGNEFYTTNYGVYVEISQSFDQSLNDPIVNKTIAFGNFTITGNHFTGGSRGVEFSGTLGNELSGILSGLINSQATVGNMLVDNNIFTDQEFSAMSLDYWNVGRLYGTSSVVLGDLTVSNNTITSDSTLYPDCGGIDIDDIGSIRYVFEESTVTTGTVTVTDNTVDVSGHALYLNYNTIFELGARTSNDPVLVTMGATTISGNNFTSANGYGSYIHYLEIANNTYGKSKVILGPLNYSGNTVVSGWDSLYLEAEFWGETMYDDSSLLINPITISNNISLTASFVESSSIRVALKKVAWDMTDNASVHFQGLNITDNPILTGESYGISLTQEVAGFDMSQNSSLTLGPVNISHNIITAASVDGIYLANSQVGWLLDDTASVTMDPVTLSDNIIDAAGDAIYSYWDEVAYRMYNNASFTAAPWTVNHNTLNGDDYGLNIDYSQLTVASEMRDDSTATLPNWVITNNTIDVQNSNDGIQIYSDTSSEHNSNDAAAHLGSFFIDNNTFNPDKDSGMYNGIYLEVDAPASDASDTTLTTFGGITVTNNKLYAIENEAVSVRYTDVAYSFTGAPALTMGDIEIGNNLIDEADFGIYLVLDHYTEAAGKVSIGALNIHDNELLNVNDIGISALYNNQNKNAGTAALTIGDVTIASNSISGISAVNTEGIFLKVVNTTEGITFAPPAISGNTVSGFAYGMYFGSVEEANIGCNTVENNVTSGLFFDTDGTFTVTSNSLVGNGLGIKVAATAASTLVVNAEENWWGDSAGPAACAACNKIDKGPATVNFAPWLASAPPSPCSWIVPSASPFPWTMFMPAITGMGGR